MKKLITSTLAILLLVQSVSPAAYAAKPVTTDSSVAKEDTAKGQDNLMITYKSFDLTKANALQVLQVAAYGFAYAKGGADVFSDKTTYTSIINKFLDKNAPNFKYRIGDEIPPAQREGTARQEWLATDWQKSFPKEYDAVYAIAKSRQTPWEDQKKLDSMRDNSREVPATQACTLSKADEQKLFDAKRQYEKLTASGDPKWASEAFKTIQTITSTCGSNTSAVQFRQACSTAYERYMTEYKNLVAVNAPYEKIKEIKDKIASAEKGEGCTIETKTTQTIEQHKSLVEKVKKTIDFGATAASVIPDGIIPAYCTDTEIVSGLEAQLSSHDLPKLSQIKQDIQTILENNDSMSKGNRRSILNFALGKTATLETRKLMDSDAANKESSAVNNFVASIAWLADALLNSDGMTTILAFIDGNMRNVRHMLDSLDKAGGLTSFKDVIAQWGNAYSWDGSNFVTEKDGAKQSDITFAFPATKDTNSNNALFTLSALKLHSYTKESYYGANELRPGALDKYDISTPKGFAEATKAIGYVNNVGIPVSEVSSELYNELQWNGVWSSEDKDGTKIDQVSFYVAQVGKYRKAYKDPGLNNSMPAGTYVGIWSTYEIAENGDIHEFYTDELPGQITAKIEVDSKLIAALEAKIEWPTDKVLSTTRDAFPLGVSVKLYLANFLITANLKRENVKDNDWRITFAWSIAGPSICAFTVDAQVNYTNGTEGSMEIQPQDITNATADLVFNSDALHFNIDDFAGLFNEIQSLQANTSNPSSPSQEEVGYGFRREETTPASTFLEDAVRTANDYIDATYSFAGDKLATIKADIDNYAVVQYPNGEQDAVMTLAKKYLWLVDTTYIQQVFGEVLWMANKDEKKWYEDDRPRPTPAPEEDASTFYSSINQDAQWNYTVNYNFTNTDRTNTAVVYPENIYVEVFTKTEDCMANYCNTAEYAPTFDGEKYIVDASWLNDPSIVAAYIYAWYTAPNQKRYALTDYIVGSQDNIQSTPVAPAPPAPAPEKPAPNPNVSLDIAGYSLMSAMDPTQIMIGFKLSDSDNLIAPDSADLVLYTIAGTKTLIPLTQGPDGYYAAPNDFATDENIQKAVIYAYYTTAEGQSIGTSYTVKWAQ